MKLDKGKVDRGKKITMKSGRCAPVDVLACRVTNLWYFLCED